MKSYLVMTVLGPDRPGLVSQLADAVASYEGNWLESRMARFAGQFAGIVRIECDTNHADSLIEKLRASDLTITVVREALTEAVSIRTLIVDVVGNDRPGIVRDLTSAIAGTGGNIEELTTGLESAPMSGHPLFRAHGVISIPESADINILTIAIERLGGDLTVDISAC